MHKRQIAIITGFSLILMAIIAGYSIGYAYPEFYQLDQINSLKENILDNQALYGMMLIGICAILVLDFVVSYTLYVYFKEDNQRISLLSGILRIAYTILFGIATIYLAKNLTISELSNELINKNFQLFQAVWNSALIIFGFHILLIGALMKLHRKIPKALWYLAIIAGISYVLVHVLKLTSPSSEFVSTMEMILALPMAIGELALAIWLLVKGGKETKNSHATSL